MPEGVLVRRVRMSEADRVRSIRLEALGDPDAGMAFLETREDAEQRPSGFWQQRTVVAAIGEDAAQFIAEAGRDWVGTIGVLIPDAASTASESRTAGSERALVVAVYVRPSYRGRGILDSLVEAAGDWAHERGREELVLDVHEDNARAQRAYSRLGFIASGGTWESANGIELEMVIPL